MTHNEARTDWYKEAIMSMLSGFLYGATNTITGHPLDTVKTKIQAQGGFMDQKNKSKVLSAMQTIWKTEGWLGFYKGWVPPFFGSVIFRSA